MTHTPNQPWPVHRQYVQPHSGFLGNSRILISAVFTPSTHPELPASLTEDDAVDRQTEHTTIACASSESLVRSRSVNLINGFQSIISVVLTNLKRKKKSESKSPLTRCCQWLRSCFPFRGLWPEAAPTKLQACSLKSPSGVV